MKKERFLLIILCFCFIFNLNKEAFANGKKDDEDKSPFMENFMKNMEVDLRLSYGFYMHHHYEMEGYRAHFPIFELSLQRRIVKFGFDLVYDSNDILRNIKTGTDQRLGFKIDFSKHIYSKVTLR